MALGEEQCRSYHKAIIFYPVSDSLQLLSTLALKSVDLAPGFCIDRVVSFLANAPNRVEGQFREGTY
jgi:uncharacterized protein Usg